MLLLFRIIYFPLTVGITSLITLPFCLVRPRSYKNTELFLNIYTFLAYPLMGFEFEMENKEILDKTKPAVVVGNHQHNLDMIMASQVFNHKIVSLGKRQIGFIPLFGIIFWLAGNILITRGNKKSAMNSMKKVEDYLRRENLGVVIFPEGHRNKTAELLPFKKGAFYTAVHCQVPIVIFAVSHYARFMQLNKWKAGKIFVKVMPPIETKGLTVEDIPMLMEKVRTQLALGISQVNQKAGYQ